MCVVDIAISAIIVSLSCGSNMYKLIDSSTVDFATIFEYIGACRRCRRHVLAWFGTLYSSCVLLSSPPSLCDKWLSFLSSFWVLL